MAKNPLWGRLRFPIEMDVGYACLKHGRVSAVGVGKTLQISSREILFTTQYPLKTGDRVRLVLDWPAMLDNSCPMKLEICGSVVQSYARTAAVKIDRHEFRTRSPAIQVMRACAL